MKDIRIQSFGEDIGNLLGRGKISSGEKTITKFVTNNVTINFNMFDTLVKNWILSNEEGRLIVIIESHGIFVGDAEIMK